MILEALVVIVAAGAFAVLLVILPGAARIVRLGVAIALPLAVAAFCLFPPRGPMIVFAWGYEGGLRLFQPLKQNKWQGWLSVVVREDVTIHDYVDANWDGQYLFVDGWCFCGEPYAPRGSFVFAILPKGFAYATRQPHPKYKHMSKPVYVSRSQLLTTVLPYVLGASVLVGVGPWLVARIRWRRIVPPGHCQTCRYDLTGNVSGRCPECGTPV